MKEWKKKIHILESDIFNHYRTGYVRHYQRKYDNLLKVKTKNSVLVMSVERNFDAFIDVALSFIY